MQYKQAYELTRGQKAVAVPVGGAIPGALAGMWAGAGRGVPYMAAGGVLGALGGGYGMHKGLAGEVPSLKGLSGVSGDYGDAAVGSGILGLGALGYVARGGNWRSKLLGAAVAAPLGVAGLKNLFDNTAAYEQGVTDRQEAHNTAMVEAEKERPKYVSEPVNLATYIKYNPGKAAIGALGISGLAYAAAGGNEGVARKLQAMKDNPGATAAGLGSIGVLSAATYNALKDLPTPMTKKKD